MFGIRKLKRRINDLDISRNEWMKIAKTGLEEIKTLKEENAKLKLDDERWRTQTGNLAKEIESRDNEIKTLEARNKEFEDSIRSGIVQERRLKDSIKTIKEENDKLKSAVEEKDNTIKTLESEVERLTRKRDANGRFVKMSREFEEGNKATAWTASPDDMKMSRKFKVGDKVKLKAIEECNKGTYGLLECMIPCDNEVGEVLRIDTDGTADVIFENNGVSFWYYTDWLEHAD